MDSSQYSLLVIFIHFEYFAISKYAISSNLQSFLMIVFNHLDIFQSSGQRNLHLFSQTASSQLWLPAEDCGCSLQHPGCEVKTLIHEHQLQIRFVYLSKVALQWQSEYKNMFLKKYNLS